MIEAETKKAESNGRILRVGRKGLMKFAIGEVAVLDPTRPALEINADVIALYNEYCEVDAPFWEGQAIIKGKESEHVLAKWNLVRSWILQGGKALREDAEAAALAESVTLAEAMELIRMVTDEYVKLKPFFLPKVSESESSSPENYGLRFST